MALENVKLCLALVLVTMIYDIDKATAQSGCSSVLLSLAPCLNYITGSSTTPSSSCCSQLSSVVQSRPQCLCSALNGGGSSLGITINQTQALSLPGACNVQTPPVSRCNGAKGPAAPPVSSAVSPASSPVSSAVSPEASPVSSAVSPSADSSDEAPDTPATSSMPNIPSGTGSKTVPTAEDRTSKANILKMPLTLTLFTMFIASFISLITFG
ncbi:hypothetical protein DITRI_Ditri11bG0090700 [Diplodiscus trichospermus]